MSIRQNKFDFTSFSRKSGSSSPTYSPLFKIIGKSTKKRRTLILPNNNIIAFAVAGLTLVFALQGILYLSSANQTSTQILGAATSAYSQISDGGSSLLNQNFASAKGLFVSAQNNIRIAQEKLSHFALLKLFAPQAQSADRMLSGASDLALAGGKLSQALALFEDLKISSQGLVTQNVTEKISANRQLLIETKELVDRAAQEFQAVGVVPSDYADTLSQGKQQVLELSSLLGKLIGLEDLYLGFFNNTARTYLLVFQNYDEARATGGFIGTYGVLKTASGKINSLRISSVYDLDGQIFESIAAPGPFQPNIKKWVMRDANWFADFPTSAEKLLYFFELGGETADGVIAVTPELFSNLLKLTGPIEMSQYQTILTAENFQQVVQFETSVDYDRKLNQPKRFLADFAPVLLNRLTTLEPTQWLDLFQIFENNLKQKQILLYNTDKSVQEDIVRLGFAGQIIETDLDYLMIVNSNLGGTKTDLSIDQDVQLVGKILSDGSVLNTLTISRQNRAAQLNKNFLRVLVPSGSQLVSASGFEPYDFQKSQAQGMKTDPDLADWDEGQMNSDVYTRSEGQKTEFSGWVRANTGQKRTVTLSYILPFKISSTYSLLIQKQSGSKAYIFAGNLDYGSRSLIWASPSAKKSGNVLSFGSLLATDDFWGVVLK